jgi:hypothetical protein
MKSPLYLCIAAFIMALGVTAAPTPGEANPLTTGRFSLPPDSKDGLYIHSLDENGNQSLEYLGVVNATGLPALDNVDSDALSKRQSTFYSCAGRFVDATSLRNAEDGLAGICGQGLEFRQSISYQWGSAIAYGCNYGNGQTCHSGDVRRFYNGLTNACGGSQTGWTTINEWHATYGVTVVGTGFC